MLSWTRQNNVLGKKSVNSYSENFLELEFSALKENHMETTESVKIFSQTRTVYSALFVLETSSTA